MKTDMDLTILQERIKVPLFHVEYDVMVSNSMLEMKELLETVHPGVTIKIDESFTGYTCLISHPEHGSYLYVLINTAEYEEFPPMRRRIAHECIHLSWEIMDTLGIEVSAENNEIQAYIMEELVDKVTIMVDKFTKNDLDSLDKF